MSVDKRLLDEFKKMRSYFNSFVEDSVRPDEWIMQEWVRKCDAAIAKAEAEVDVETRWIEIKPGCDMPTHKQKVDIWIQIGDNPGWRFPYAEWVATSDGPWWCNDDGETIEEAYVYGDDGFHCVTHWMPIPAAPVAVEYQGKDKP